MYRRDLLKQEVKQTISAVRPRPMWVTLLFLVITSLGASVVQGVVNLLSDTSFFVDLLYGVSERVMGGDDPDAILQELILLYSDRLIALVGTLVVSSLILSVILTLWQGLMNVGYNGYCLSLVRGENPGINRIFCGFPLVGKVILTRLLVWIFTSLWLLLFAVGLAAVILIAVLVGMAPVVSILLIFAGYVAFMVLAVRVNLRYAMTDFVLLDTGKYGLEAISESRDMMKGKKGKLFLLQLSFIGWYLLLFAVVLVGSLLIGIIAAAGAVGLAGGGSLGAAVGMVGGILLVLLLTLAAVWLLRIWLQPYVSSCVAKFYLCFRLEDTMSTL